MNRRNVWMAFSVFGLLLCAAPSPATAQPDSGDFEILQARYGTAAQNVDVTQKLKELARRDRSFKLGNDSFGVDPAYNQVKTLRIFTRARDGQNRTFEYREGQIVDGAQFSAWGSGNWNNSGWSGGWGGNAGNAGNTGNANNGGDSGEWRILQARYGTAAHNIDVTDRLKDLARRDRVFRLTNGLFGADPHPNHVKQLRIYARGNNGQTRTFEFAENSSIDGSQFIGWRNGNWGQGGWNGGWGSSGNTGSGGGTAGKSLTIVTAVYGAGRQTVDVTQRLRERLRDGRLEVRADNDLAGRDPAPQVAKILRITYSVNGGRSQQAEFNENSAVRLP